LARADKKIDVACRRCRAHPETLGHILRLCQYTKGLRIKRHDEVKFILADNLRKNNRVFVEPTLRVGGNLGNPVKASWDARKKASQSE
jgi:ribosomal protein L40E